MTFFLSFVLGIGQLAKFRGMVSAYKKILFKKKVNFFISFPLATPEKNKAAYKIGMLPTSNVTMLPSFTVPWGPPKNRVFFSA